MQIDENKYNQLFIEKFKVKKEELDSEYKRVLDEYGDTEEVKMNFYLKVFETLIIQIKKDLPKDKDYEYLITKLYNHFIEILEIDKIDSSKYKSELAYFKSTEIISIQNERTDKTKNYEPVYKNYNLNTKYGRRKAREQAALNYHNGTPEYKREINNIAAVVWVIIFIICLIVYFIKQNLN